MYQKDKYTIEIQKGNPFYNNAEHILKGLAGKPLYQIDAYIEGEVNKFVESHIAPVLFSDYTANDVPFLQNAGIDLFTRMYGSVDIQFIDIKSAARYYEGKLNSFVMELGYVTEHTKNPIIGWFLREGICTSHYLLLWPKATPFGNIYKSKYEKTYHIYGENDIEYVDFVLVEKKAIHEYIEKHGLTKEYLSEHIYEWTKNEQSRRQENERLKGTGLEINLSPIETKPVNLKIDKAKYIELGIQSGRVCNYHPVKIYSIK